MVKFTTLWEEITGPIWPSRLIQIGVQFYDLIANEQMRQLELFDSSPRSEGRAKLPEIRLRLAQTIDALNKKLGWDAVTLGLMPGTGRSSTPKIAFTRVPKLEEFRQ
jgi:hypothetical protein